MGCCDAALNTVLLVDDLRFNRIVLRKMLYKLGFDVLEAENGVEALELFYAQRSSLCCIFLDLQMPVMDGWETAQRLREFEEAEDMQRTPIVACSAVKYHELRHDGISAAHAALQSGVDELMVKPPSLERLTQTLSKYIPRLPVAIRGHEAVLTAGPVVAAQ